MAISTWLIVAWGMFFGGSFFLLSKRKSQLLCQCFFVVLCFIPVEIVGLFSGYSYSVPGKLNISLQGYLVVFIFLSALIHQSGSIYGNAEKNYSLFLGMIFLFGIRVIVDGTKAFSNKMLDNYFLPVILAIWILGNRKKLDVYSVMRVFYICILINSGIAIVEYLVGKSLLFHSYYLSTVPWYQNVYYSTAYGVAFRSTAFLGHPLTAGVFYVLAFVFLLHYWKEQRTIWSIIQLTILLGAIYTTNSRGALLCVGAYLVYFLLKERKYGKFALLLFLVAIILSYVDLGSLYDKVFARDAGGSSLAVRFNALKIITRIPLKELLLGVGYNNTSTLLRSLGFTTNLEIAFLIVLLENGLVGFGIWCFLIFTIYRRKKRSDSLERSTLRGALLCFVMLSCCFNSFGDPGILNYLFWGMLALEAAAEKERKE